MVCPGDWHHAHLSRQNRRTKRCSEREPADSLRDKSNVRGGWLPSLTFAFGAISLPRMRILKVVALVSSLGVHGAELPRDGGIGVVLGVAGQNIVVKRILPESPAAAHHDLHVGDRILAVAQHKEPALQVESGRLAQTIP